MLAKPKNDFPMGCHPCHAGSILFVIKYSARLKKDSSKMTSSSPGAGVIPIVAFSCCITFLIAILSIATNSSAQDRYPQSTAALRDSVFLDFVQRASFDFFWQEANPSNGLIKDRNTSLCSIAAVGFGLSSICVAIDRLITREQGRRACYDFKNVLGKPQGRNPQGCIGYKKFYYHFLDITTAART
jgi:hypothetical protein